jgi:hypothetical protein
MFQQSKAAGSLGGVRRGVPTGRHRTEVAMLLFRKSCGVFMALAMMPAALRR